jgi:hypothetical protein
LSVYFAQYCVLSQFLISVWNTGLVFTNLALRDFTEAKYWVNIFTKATWKYEPKFHYCQALYCEVLMLLTQAATEVACDVLKKMGTFFDGEFSDDMIRAYGRDSSTEAVASIPFTEAVLGRFGASLESAKYGLVFLKESKVLPSYLGGSCLRLAVAYVRLGMFSTARDVFNEYTSVNNFGNTSRKRQSGYSISEIYSTLVLWFNGLASSGDPLLLVCQRAFPEVLDCAPHTLSKSTEIRERAPLPVDFQKLVQDPPPLIVSEMSVAVNVELVRLELCLLSDHFEEAEHLASKVNELGALGFGDSFNRPELLTLHAVAKVGLYSLLAHDAESHHLKDACKLLEQSINMSKHQGGFNSVLCLFCFCSIVAMLSTLNIVIVPFMSLGAVLWQLRASIVLFCIYHVQNRLEEAKATVHSALNLCPDFHTRDDSFSGGSSFLPNPFFWLQVASRLII